MSAIRKPFSTASFRIVKLVFVTSSLGLLLIGPSVFAKIRVKT